VDEIVKSAAQGAINLQRYALDSGASALVLTSSVSIYGQIRTSIVDETTPILEPDIYGASKFLVERTFATTANTLPVIAFRLPSVLGCLESGAWVPSLTRRLLKHENVTIFNPKATFNNAIDVDELSRFIVSLIAKSFRGFHAFPIAASGSMTVAELVALLRTSVHSNSVISIDATPKRSFVISSTYAKSYFHYEPIDIHATIRRFLERVVSRNK